MTAVKAAGYVLLLAWHADPNAGVTMLGFAWSFAFLVTFYPALLLFEPFAAIVTVWYTTHRSDDEPLDRLVIAWLALAVHSLVVVSYLRTWHR